MGGYADRARQLAYVLFQKATDKGWADEAGAYNGLRSSPPRASTGSPTCSPRARSAAGAPTAFVPASSLRTWARRTSSASDSAPPSNGARERLGRAQEEVDGRSAEVRELEGRRDELQADIDEADH